MESAISRNNLNNIEIVVGIDFGTTYSAYAYSYAYEKDKIFINSDWPSGSQACKETTAILFNEDKEFVAFGEEAVEKFNSLADDDEESSWYFFNLFKMALYEKKVCFAFHFLSYFFFLLLLKLKMKLIVVLISTIIERVLQFVS